MTHEIDLWHRFVLQGSHLTGHLNSWETLGMMQHLGVPTRLLDWTGSLAAAVFFAINSARPEDQPCLWVLSPMRLMNKAVDASELHERERHELMGCVPHFSGKRCYDFEKHLIQRSPTWPFAYPVPTELPWENRRVAAQSGCFSVHGTNPIPVEAQDGATFYTRKVCIPKAAECAAWEFTRHSGINRSTLFPDLQGLSDHLNEFFGFLDPAGGCHSRYGYELEAIGTYALIPSSDLDRHELVEVRKNERGDYYFKREDDEHGILARDADFGFVGPLPPRIIVASKVGDTDQ